MSRAWTLISIAEGRQYGGNLGYEDDPSRVYRYDSSVPNHLQVRQGDIVFVRNRQSVLGMARIERIETAEDSKIGLRCPFCGSPQIKERHRTRPRWRCVKAHLFDDPAQHATRVNTYEAHYGGTFVSLGSVIGIVDLKRAALRPNDQLSIEEVDGVRLADQIIPALPTAIDFFGKFLQARTPDASGDDYARNVANRDDSDSDYSPSIGDTRERIIRSINLRRGQGSFRKKLIRRYGACCMITGCELMDIIEAAHIWPYRGADDNHPENGLLLRADLHTLFDLDLLGINPEDLQVRIHQSAHAAGYKDLDGVNLRTVAGFKPSGQALTSRWTSFLERFRGPAGGSRDITQRRV